MGWQPNEVAAIVPRLQVLARLKYDEYEGFSAGVKFSESLAWWLMQFEPADRNAAIDFILKRLVFVSRAELDHIIRSVYDDVIRRHLLKRTAADIAVPPYRVAFIARSEAYRALERRTLILGLSDGARLDRVRRSSPLSHEQFYLVADPSPDRIEAMAAKLREALVAKGLADQPTFRQVVLVDDFSGSGLTLLREQDGSWLGKLWQAHRLVQQLAGAGLMATDTQVMVVLYIATQQATQHLVGALSKAKFQWDLEIVQILDRTLKVESPQDDAIINLCRKHYDPMLVDQHKLVGGTDAALGFADGRLPLVLFHNTPNNSICLLWGDTTERRSEGGLRALFVRHERHHPDRP